MNILKLLHAFGAGFIVGILYLLAAGQATIRELGIAAMGAILGFSIGSIYKTLLDRDIQVVEVIRDSDYGSVVYLPGSSYHRFVTKLIEEAAERVYVAVYVASIGPRSKQLLDAVVKSSAREKLVVLESERDAPGSQNREVVEYLRKRGVEAMLAPGRNTQHLKLVVADDWVVVGSHNWTERALARNDEVSIAIRSRRLAERAIEDIKKVAKGEKI